MKLGTKVSQKAIAIGIGTFVVLGSVIFGVQQIAGRDGRPTPTPSRVTEVVGTRPVETKIPPTVTVVPTDPAPTVKPPTATIGATVTTPPTIVVSPSPTSIVAGHDVWTWHKPGIAFHHHGENWENAHPAIVTWLKTHKYGNLFSQIGNLWASSAIENVYPWPMGKHEGFVNLVENDTHCDLGKMEPQPGQNCVKAYLFQPHVLGNAQEFRARIHSEKLVALVCDFETQSKCGIVATGGLVDYGEAHANYKKQICPLADNPPYPPQYSVDQPPYRTVNGSSRQFMFWSSLTNPVIKQFFDVVPNNLLQVAWNNRPFSSPSLDDCTDPGSDIHFTNKENRNNTFQVFGIYLNLAQFPRPFEGFTDLHGNEDKTCTIPTNVCVPLSIGKDVPLGDAILNRIVDMGDPEKAPIQTFGMDVILLPPGSILPPTPAP